MRKPKFTIGAYIYLKDTNELIGTIYLYTEDKIAKVGSISYCLGCDWWGSGYMQEALKAVISFAFERIGYNRIEAFHAKSNTQSARVMQKAGMTLDGTLRQRAKHLTAMRIVFIIQSLKMSILKNKRKIMKIFEDKDNGYINEIIALSAEWEKENITCGYACNDVSDIDSNKIFIATDNNEVIAYLFGMEKIAENMSSVIPDGRRIFVINELYVKQELRSKGIGRRLFKYAEQTIKSEGVEYITLNTATKNYKAILHFYIDEMDMEFWSAELYKKLI